MKKINNDNFQWHSRINVNLISLQLQTWLSYSGSFIEHLKQHGILNPTIGVLQQVWDVPFASELVLLKLSNQSQALIREVLIKSENAVWMFARTVFPKETLTGQEEKFLSLQDQSLGSVLFNYPDLKRSEFEFACLNSNCEWHKKIAQQVELSDQDLWARRSIFTVNNKPILLSEVFLPAMHQL